MNPRLQLTLLRIAVLVQCFTIFMVLQTSWKYQRMAHDSMEVNRVMETNVVELQAIIGQLTGLPIHTNRAVPGTILVVTNGQPKWVKP